MQRQVRRRARRRAGGWAGTERALNPVASGSKMGAREGGSGVGAVAEAAAMKDDAHKEDKEDKEDEEEPP